MGHAPTPAPFPPRWHRAAGPASTPRSLRGSHSLDRPRGKRRVDSDAPLARAAPVTEHHEPFNALLSAKGSLRTAAPCAAPSPPRCSGSDGQAGLAPCGLAGGVGAAQPLRCWPQRAQTTGTHRFHLASICPPKRAVPAPQPVIAPRWFFFCMALTKPR